jgi:hypothetical protein
MIITAGGDADVGGVGDVSKAGIIPRAAAMVVTVAPVNMV